MMRGRFRLIAVVALPAVLFASQPGHAQDVRAAVDQLAIQIAKGIPANRQLRLAVADFPDLQGVTSELGRFVGSRLTTRLALSPNLFIVERQRLSQVLAELRFSMSDLVDPAKAKQLGRMAGVEAIVVGALSDFGNQVDVDARIIDIETNRMLFATSVTISKDPSVLAMIASGRQEPARPSPTPLATPSSTPNAQTGPSGPVVTAEGVTFHPRGCRRAAETVVCTIAFINITTDDREMMVSTSGCGNLRSRLIDNNGTEYIPLVAVGGQQAESCSSRGRLPPQLPLNVRFLTKDPVPASATHMTVAIGLQYIKNSNWADFRNLVIIRDVPVGP